MSATIDERVVEMRFDNKQFESNVATSMSTLKKLKRSLKFDGASKGLEEINNASKNINMSGLGGAVDTVKAKFSALDVVAVTALANITNQAVNAGKRMVAALTIDPIKTGFKEYETQINAVQTILANTSSKGTTINDVTAALDELNRYADLTIYNFTEMTRNIGTFTAAGIDLETSVSAIQGIANLAAVSGSTSQQASVAMYQLSQALASGTVKLMDWNSVVNAGMGGEVFQNALKETSRLLGTGADEAIKASGSFRESLGKGWLTAEVLTETLKKFTTSGANEYVAEYTGLSVDAIQATLDSAKAQYGEAEAIDKAAEALANKSGKSKDEIKSVLQMARTAEDAATKVKTFSQLWDVMKEAAQSGWSKTWQIIIGDFEEAKALLTPLSDFFTNIINKMSDWRNDLLESALGKGFANLADKINGVLKPASEAAETIGKVTDTVSDLGEIVDKVIRGDFGNETDRFNALTEAGENYYRVQNKVNETLGNAFRYSEEQIAAQDELLGKQKETSRATEEASEATSESKDETVKLTDAQKDQIKTLIKLSDAELKAKGYTDEQIEAFRELRNTAEKLGIPINEFIDNLDEINGRWLLINSFKNVGKALIKVFTSIGKAWREIFDPIQSDEIFDVIAAIRKFTSSLIPSEETAKKLTKTFKGLFAILDIIKTAVGGGLKIAFKALSAVLSAFDVNILDVTANIGDALVAFHDWLLEGNALAKAINGLIDKLPSLVEKFNEWFDAFKQTPAVKKLVDAIDAISEAFDKLTSGEINLSEFASSFGENLAKALKSIPEIAIQIAKDFIEGFQNGIGDSMDGVIDDVVQFCLDFIASFAEALGVQSPSWKAYDTATDFFQGFINGAKDMIGSVLDILKRIGEEIVKVFKSFWDFITDENGNIEWGKLFAGGVVIAMIWVLKQIATAFDGIANALGGIDDLLANTGKVIKSFSKVLNGVAWELKAQALQKMAIAIAILVASIWVLTQIDDPAKIWNAVGVIAVLAVVLIGLSIAMDKLSSASVQINKKGASLDGLKTGLLQIGMAILLLAATVKLIGDLDPEKAKQGFIGLAGVAGGLILFLAAIGGISRYSGDVDGVGKMMLKIAIAMGVMALVMKTVARMDPSDIIIGLAVMEAFVLLCVEIGIANRIAGTFGNKLGGNILKISVAIGIMILAMKMIAGMDPADVVVGIAVLQSFVILIGEMAIINRLAGDNQTKFGRTIMSMATSMMIMASVIWILSKMDESAIDKGIKIMQKFVLLIGEMILVSKLAGKESAKIAGNILAMSLAISVLAGVAILLSFVDVNSLTKGITAVGILGLIMAAMIQATRGTQNVMGNLITMTVAIVIMAGAVVALSYIDGASLSGAVAALDSLMLCFGLMTVMASKVKNTKSMRKTLLLMIGVVSIMAGLVALLSLVDPKNAVPNTVALSSLMLAFAATFKILDGVKISTKVTKNLQSMVLVVLEVAAILSLMSFLPNPTNMIPSAIAIGILLNTLATSILIMSKAKGNFKTSFVQLQSMALVMVEIAAILSLMSFLPNPTNMIPIAIAIGILLNALAAALLIASLAGPNATVAASAMVVMGIALAEIGLVLGLLSAFNIAPSIETALALSTLLLAMSAACLIVSKIPVGAGLTGALELAKFIGVMALVVAAAGAISMIPGVDTLLAGGGDLLGLLGLAIGKFVGGIIAGVAGGVISIIPQLGIALSVFAVGVRPFIALVSGLDASVIAGAGYLTAAILALSAASFISGIMNILSLGQSSLTKLGAELYIFGSYSKIFFDTIKDVDPTAVEAANNVAGMILALTASEAISSIIEKFGGSVDFSSLGQNLQSFGDAVVGFSNTISGKIDVASVEAATNAGLLLVELNKSLPRSGGWVQDVIGEKDFGKFAESCKAFASCILGINEVVSQEGFEIQSEKISQLVTAGTQFSELNNALPRSGGIAQDLAGEQDLAGFGASCKAFAKCMIAISRSVSSDEFVVQSDKISKLVTAGTQFNELNTALPKTGGIAQDFAGEQDLGRFGAAVAAFAACMILVNQAISQEGFSVNLEGMESIKQAGLKMNELQNSLPKSGGWWQDVAGEQDIGDFGNKIKTFADAIVDFSTSSANLDQGAISTCISTVRRIKNLMISLIDLDYSGVEAFTGVGTGGIGADGPAYDIAKAISKFSDEVANINTEAVTVAVTAARKLKSLIASLVGLDASGIENFKPCEIGKQMKSYSDKVSSIDTGIVSSSISSANRLKNFIAGLVGLDTSGISNFKVGSIGNSLKTYSASVSSFNIGAVSNSISAANKLKIFIASLAGLDTGGVGSFKSAITELSTVNINDVVKAFSGASSKLSHTGADMINCLINGMQSKLPDIKTIISKILSSANDAISSRITAFEKAGGTIATRLAGGFSSKTGEITSAISSCLSKASSSIRDKYGSFYNAGSYSVTGFCNGISDNSYKAAAKAKAMAESAVEAARKALKINSPSKVFKEIGSGVPEGFAIGIGMLGSTVKGSVDDMASTAITSTRSAMTTILDALNGDIDSQPTIRPVIDLTDVRTGANAIHGMFDGVQTVGVRSNLNAINATMNAKLQNGTNDDIVSAINKLNDGLENNRGDVYNFGSFTYDDGSNIHEAVRTLVRAAKMERRV